MKIGYLLRAALFSAVLTTDAAWGQHTAQADHMGHASPLVGVSVPTERGDASFAAIAEIVSILDEDLDTDWSRVEIDALRLHLVDMTELVLGADFHTRTIPNGVEMEISLSGRAGAAASRMVPAHAPVLSGQKGWSSQVDVSSQSLKWTVVDPAGNDGAQIQALGFFGLMATGDHHRAHHIAIARGVTMH